MCSLKIANEKPLVTNVEIRGSKRPFRKHLRVTTRNGQIFNMFVKSPSHSKFLAFFEHFFWFQINFNGTPLLINKRSFTKQTGFTSTSFRKTYDLEFVFSAVMQSESLRKSLTTKGFTNRKARQIALKLMTYIQENKFLIRKQLKGVNAKVLFLQPIKGFNLIAKYQQKNNKVYFYTSRKNSRPIGKGRFKTLFAFFNVQTGKEDRIFAFREIKNRKDHFFGRNEFVLLQILKNIPQVVKSYFFFEDEHFLGMNLEKCDGNLGDLFRDEDWNLDLKTKLKIFAKVLEAVQKIHDCEIIHRDLKESNILYNLKNLQDGRVCITIKIADFDLACDSKNNALLKLRVGTSIYMAPESIGKELKKDPYKLDVWSLGMMLYRIYLNQFPPYTEKIRLALHDKKLTAVEQKSIVLEGIKTLRRQLNDKDPWLCLILKALEPEVEKRLSIREFTGEVQILLTTLNSV